MSAAPLIQSTRPLEITTPLGADVVGLRSIRVQEQLSGGFTIEAELSSLDPSIKFDDIVGHPVTVRLDLPNKEKRFWHGYVARFYMVGESGHVFHYRAVIVHWLWALTRSADCRIFQKLAVPDIAQQVFRDCGEKDFKVRLSGTYPQLEYCVQYRETHFNFVSRLLEQEGIAYYYTHDAAAGTLVLADEKAAYDPAPGYDKIRYVPVGGDEKQQEAIKTWIIENEVQPTEYGLTDYNPLKPKEAMLRVERAARDYGLNNKQIFDYPGGFAEATDSERLSHLRLDELQVASELARAQTTCLGLGAGNLFTLEDHPRPEQNRQYLITALNLYFDAGEFSSREKAETRTACDFTAVPASYAFRPPRVTPKPVVHGPQPAVVVGPSGEEIHTDEHGRVKVHFFWDRYNKNDENASCWLRVAQGWAGKRWGSLFLPRIGQEVLVDFLEGDPDRPLVTGSMYNADMVPPYPLPAQKTISTLKSDSTKGGKGFNEIRFEDKKGDEQIYIHGEKNMDIRIKNDVFETVENNRHLTVKKDLLEHVENNRDEIVDADHKEAIGKDRHLSVAGKEAKAVEGSLSLSVKGDVIEVFKANHSEQVTTDYYLKGDNIVIEGMTNVTIKVGQSSIAIAADGIAIKTDQLVKIESGTTADLKSGTALTLDAGTALAAKGGATAEVKSPATTVKSDANLTLKGGMVMIN